MNGYELTWGVPVILYLFLAGVGAGALTASASMFLRGGPTGRYFNIARYGAFLAAPLVIIGTGMLVFELGSFQAGHQPVADVHRYLVACVVYSYQHSICLHISAEKCCAGGYF